MYIKLFELYPWFQSQWYNLLIIIDIFLLLLFLIDAIERRLLIQTVVRVRDVEALHQREAD